MANILGTSTLLPNASNEQVINLGMTPTRLTITVVMNTAGGWCKSEGKATASYQHCQSEATDKTFNESGYVVRIRDKSGTTYPVVATAKLKSINTGSITLKEITAPAGACQLLIEASN